ncbi:MAG: DUF4174 domain-containing protein [Planktomarina sp.]
MFKTLMTVLAVAGSPLMAETTFDTWADDPSVVIMADDADLADFKWRARPMVIFADSPLDPKFIEQMDLLSERIGDVTARDIALIIDTDPDANTVLRQKFRPHGFVWLLIDKDGEIKLRKPFPWDMRELSRSIDKMPSRQQEVEAARGR